MDAVLEDLISGSQPRLNQVAQQMDADYGHQQVPQQIEQPAVDAGNAWMQQGMVRDEANPYVCFA